jgi:hypothetical protein
MKHLKLFENFTIERNSFTEVTEEEYEERNVSRSNIDKYYDKISSTYYPLSIYRRYSTRSANVSCYRVKDEGESSYLIINVIERRRDGTNGDNKLELLVTLNDDDWFMVRIEENEWLGSWRTREVNDDFTLPSYWKCDQIEGLMAFVDVVTEDMEGFMTH